MRVAGIVVTFNRLDLLKINLNALLHQSKALVEVLVVDNHSDNSVEEALSLEKKLFFNRGISFNVVRLSSNTGGAGGFEYGLSQYIDRDHIDAVWLMDDDGKPSITCLQTLCESYCSKIDPILHPNLFFEGKSHFAKYFDKVNRDVASFKGGPFNGTFISISNLREVGLPIARFFIWGDEVEYTNRIRSKGIPMLVVKKSKYEHKTTEINYRTNTRAFYLFRNQVWTIKLFMPVFESRLKYSLSVCIFLCRELLRFLVNLNLHAVLQSLRGLAIGILTRPNV